MKNILKWSCIWSLVCFSNVFAQQETIITQYRNNMLFVNPAYAGFTTGSELSSVLRKQWTGIKDAPETQMIALNTHLSEKIGFGVSVISDKTFIERQTFVGIDASYKVQLSAQTNLHMGIKAGGNFYNLNTSGLETYNVQADASLRDISNFSPNVGIGALVTHKKWFFSAALPRMLNTKRGKNDAGIATAATDRPHWYISTGYDFELNNNEDFILKPSILLRQVAGAPTSIDFNTLFKMYQHFEIGATYRTDKAYAAMANIVIAKRLTVGYVYEMSTRNLLASARNSNEFMMQFRF